MVSASKIKASRQIADLLTDYRMESKSEEETLERLDWLGRYIRFVISKETEKERYQIANGINDLEGEDDGSSKDNRNDEDDEDEQGGDIGGQSISEDERNEFEYLYGLRPVGLSQDDTRQDMAISPEAQSSRKRKAAAAGLTPRLSQEAGPNANSKAKRRRRNSRACKGAKTDHRVQGLKEDAVFPSDPQGWERVRQLAESRILAALENGTLKTDKRKEWRLERYFKYVTDVFGSVGENRLLSIVNEARNIAPTEAFFNLSVNARNTTTSVGSLDEMKDAYLQCMKDREERVIGKLDEMSHTIKFFLAYRQNCEDFRLDRHGVKERYTHLGVQNGRGKAAWTLTYSWLLHEIHGFSIEDLNKLELDAPKVVFDARVKMQRQVAVGAWLATYMENFGAGIFAFLPPTDKVYSQKWFRTGYLEHFVNSLTEVYPGFKEICEDIERNLLSRIRCREALDETWVDKICQRVQPTPRPGEHVADDDITMGENSSDATLQGDGASSL